MLPKRGDRDSTFVQAVALFLQTGSWWLMIWTPLAVVIGFAYFAFQGDLELFDLFFILIALAVLFLGGLCARSLARGILSGRRFAYVAMGLAVLLVAAGNATQAFSNSEDRQFVALATSQFLVWASAGILVLAVGLRRGIR